MLTPSYGRRCCLSGVDGDFYYQVLGCFSVSRSQAFFFAIKSKLPLLRMRLIERATIVCVGARLAEVQVGERETERDRELQPALHASLMSSKPALFTYRRARTVLPTRHSPPPCTLSKQYQTITRNVWQSLAYSPLGAAVSPPSR